MRGDTDEVRLDAQLHLATLIGRHEHVIAQVLHLVDDVAQRLDWGHTDAHLQNRDIQSKTDGTSHECSYVEVGHGRLSEVAPLSKRNDMNGNIVGDQTSRVCDGWLQQNKSAHHADQN